MMHCKYHAGGVQVGPSFFVSLALVKIEGMAEQSFYRLG